MARAKSAVAKQVYPITHTPAPHGERISHVAENYLLSLYNLEEESVKPTPAQLADYIRHLPATEGLGSSLPTVTGMLRRMVREHLIVMSPRKEIELTPRGRVLAEDMVRRHRLAERMVVDMLGLELHLAHIEAHRLEHAISSELEQKIVEKLGNPTTCPFGRPIPKSGYIPPASEAMTLDKATTGLRYLVDRVPEEDHDLLRFLIEHAVLPNQEITVHEAGQYRGVLVFKTSVGQNALGYEAAARVWVRRLG